MLPCHWAGVHSWIAFPPSCGAHSIASCADRWHLWLVQGITSWRSRDVNATIELTGTYCMDLLHKLVASPAFHSGNSGCGQLHSASASERLLLTWGCIWRLRPCRCRWPPLWEQPPSCTSSCPARRSQTALPYLQASQSGEGGEEVGSMFFSFQTSRNMCGNISDLK